MRREKGIFNVFAVLLLVLVSAVPCAAQVVTDYWRVSPWDYWAATPTYSRMCNSSTGACYSITVSPADRHILEYQDNGYYSVTQVLASGGVGIVRDSGPGLLRCFSDIAGTCGPATYPPGFSPAFDYIPVLSTPGTTTPTPNARVYYSLQSVQINNVDPTTCAITPAGNDIHSGAHFLLSSFDFGLPLGVLTSVYVTEEAVDCPPAATNPMFCARIERYFFALGLGRVRQEGWNDPACDGMTPSLCLGNYTLPSPAAFTWNPAGPPPVSPILAEICP